MKDKAFTIVEMIAVVIILGLLLLIAVPTYNSIIAKSKDASLDSAKEQMKDAARMFVQDCIKYNKCKNDRYLIDYTSDNGVNILLEDLINNKYTEPILDPSTKKSCDIKNSYVRVTKEGDNYSYYATLICETKTKDNDDEKPSIEKSTPNLTLTTSGNDIKCNTNYKNENWCSATPDSSIIVAKNISPVSDNIYYTNDDKEYKKIDNCEVTVSSIRCSTNGITSPVTYQIKNKKDGPIGNELKSDVKIDSNAPKLDVDWGDSSNKYKRTITINANDSGSGVYSYTFKVNGRAIVNINGKDKLPDGELSTTFPLTMNANVEIIVTDYVGNEAIESKQVSGFSDGVPLISLAIDEEKEIIGPQNSYYKNPSFNLVIDAETGIVNDSFNKLNYCFSESNNGCTNWKELIMGEPQIDRDKGISKYISPTMSKPFDKTFYLYVKRIKGTNNKESSISNNENYVDQNGNIYHMFKIQIDSIAPIIQKVDVSTEWSYTNKFVTIYAQDNESGIDKYCLSSSNSVSSCVWQTQSIFSSGLGTYYAFVKDKFGNISSSYTVVVDNIDNSKPTVTLKAMKKGTDTLVNSNNWSDKGLEYTFTSSNVGPSGATIYYCKDNNNTCEPSKTISSGSKLTSYNDTTGTYYIRYRIESGAGISSSTSSYKANIDTTKPTVTLKAMKKGTDTLVNSNDWSDKELEYIFVGTNTVPSGTTIYYCMDTNNTCNPTSQISSNTKITSYNTTSGTYYIKYMMISRAGIASNLSIFTANVDTNAPTITSVYSSDETYWTKTKVVTIGANDNGGSGIVSYCLIDNNNSDNCVWTDNKIIVDNNKTYYAFVKDKVGLVSTLKTITISKIDNIAPACDSVSGQDTTWINSSRYITVLCKDDQTGCTNETFSNTFSTTTKTATIEIRDLAGNVTYCPVNVYVDKDKPTITNISQESKFGKDNFIITANDGTGSGIKEYCMQNTSKDISKCEWQTSNKFEKFDLISKTVYVRDYAGNINSKVAP